MIIIRARNSNNSSQDNAKRSRIKSTSKDRIFTSQLETKEKVKAVLKPTLKIKNTKLGKWPNGRGDCLRKVSSLAKRVAHDR